jgi:hypothetical protein
MTRDPLPGPCDIPKCPQCGEPPKGAAGVPTRYVCVCDEASRLSLREAVRQTAVMLGTDPDAARIYHSPKDQQR